MWHRLKDVRRKPTTGQLIVLGLLIIGTIAIFTRDHWLWIKDELTNPELTSEGSVAATPVVDMNDPEDFNSETERLYRITPEGGSHANYNVTERLLGSTRNTVGSTTVITGEIVVDTVYPKRSRVGELIVNVEVLESDSKLRDKRIRHDFLESSHWPFVRFVPSSFDLTSISNTRLESQNTNPELTAQSTSTEQNTSTEIVFVDDATYEVSITGELTIKDTVHTETFTGTVSADEATLTADISTTILSSDYGVGPIHIARLAHTNDAVELNFKLIAKRVEGAETSPTIADDLQREIPNPIFASGEFSATVKPVLENNCVSCHTTGGPGWSTVPLVTAGDAAAIADDIALVTTAGFMPPWLPSDLSPRFKHDWSLNEEEKAAITAWAASGGGLDIDANTPLNARKQAVLPITTVDHEISPRGGPYTSYSNPDGTPVRKDDYRCLIYEIPDPEGDGTWVKGFEFKPDRTEVVHHSIIYRAPAAAAEEIEAKIASDNEFEASRGYPDEPGWTCFGLSGLSTPGVELVQGWAPGQSPTIYPEGYGFYLAPGDIILNQIHYHYDHDIPADNSSIVIDTATPEETIGMSEVLVESFVTPAEIPCTPEEAGIAAERSATISGYTNMCVRSNVLEDIAIRFDAFAKIIPNLLLIQCGSTLNDYNELQGSVGHSSCDLPVNRSGIIHSVLGHMHEFGSAYRMTLNPDTPQERILLDIPKWDFEWQLSYEPEEDILIQKGDTLRLQCWWDRTLQHMDEPRYIIWNEGTGDEMCFSTVSTLSPSH